MPFSSVSSCFLVAASGGKTGGLGHLPPLIHIELHSSTAYTVGHKLLSVRDF